MSVSYCWLKPDHTDKNGDQLKTTSQILGKMHEGGNQNVEVFLNWCSLFQDPRSPDELVKFKNSLRNINVWYAHQSTMKILLTFLPLGAECLQYHEHGWPTFESNVASMITDGNNVIDLSGPLVLGSTFDMIQTKSCESRSWRLQISTALFNQRLSPTAQIFTRWLSQSMWKLFGTSLAVPTVSITWN